VTKRTAATGMKLKLPFTTILLGIDSPIQQEIVSQKRFKK
jgi:hypothetical protein